MSRIAPSPAILRQKLNGERCEPGMQLLPYAITAIAIAIGMEPWGIRARTHAGFRARLMRPDVSRTRS